MLNRNSWITLKENVSCCVYKKQIFVKDDFYDAFINIAVMGWYHIYIDGKRIDQTVFSPGYTDYRYRVQYQTYNLKDYLNNKKTFLLEIELADGWASSHEFAYVFRWEKEKPLAYPKSLNYELVIQYQNGETDTYVSDLSGEFYNSSVEYASIYNGEIQNINYKEKILGKPEFISIPVDIIANEGVDIVYGETFKPKKMYKNEFGELLIDFGQNFVGVIFIKIKGKKGDVISYVPGEVLNKDGSFYRANYRDAKSFYSFVLSGEEEILVPRFSFLGGRYIKLIDYPDYITIDNFEAVFVHSKMDKTCYFCCSNEKIQRLYLNTYYGQLSNYLDIPTDCPQRDERLGWCADTQIFAKTAAIHMDVHDFFVKWLNDMKISQFDDGAICPIVPYVPNCENNISTGWSDAAIVCPYEMYFAYDDKKIIYDYLDMMEKWINYLKNHQIKENIISLKFSFGDWLALDTQYVTDAFQGATRYDLISTAYYYYGVSKLIEFKKAINQDCYEYEKLMPLIKKAFQDEFIINGHMKGNKITFQQAKENEKSAYTQTGLALTLYFDLCETKDRLSLTNDLVSLIEDCSFKLTTGFLGTPYILEALAKNDRIDVAYNLLLSEKYPSWLYAISLGATTMWEHWDGIKEDGSFWSDYMNSYNHYAYGSIFSFIFERVVGIKAIKPGYKEIIISPMPDARIGNIDTKFISRNGEINVKYWFVDNEVHYDISFDEKIDGKIIINGKEEKTIIIDGYKVFRG